MEHYFNDECMIQNNSEDSNLGVVVVVIPTILYCTATRVSVVVYRIHTTNIAHAFFCPYIYAN